ncbi:MAG: hypothetical protein ACE3JK_17860 [Sporolactobacillus sp.]
MPKDQKNKFNKKEDDFQQVENLNLDEEFSEPLDEHSVEERERAQRTGDNQDTKHDEKKDKNYK